MKKLYLSILCMGILLMSCTKDENYIFEKGPDERVSELLSNYNNILISAEKGWILSLETKTGGGFNHWVKFCPDNRVEMLSDADATSSRFKNTSKVVLQSSYRLKSVQTPILMFDTYSYIHLLSDPDGSVNGGGNGSGLKTDFEFAFGEYDPNATSIVLRGRYNGSKAVLTPCTSEEYDKIMQGALKENQINFNSYIAKNYKFPVLDIGGKKVDIGLSSREISIKYINAENTLESYNTPSYIDLKSLGSQEVSNAFMFSPLSYEGSEFDKIIFDNGTLYTEIKGAKVMIVENNRPALPFRFGYKKDFSRMRINADQLSGTLTDPFLTGVYLKAKSNLYGNGKRNMQYGDIAFEYDAVKGVSRISFVIRYNNTAGSNYNATWKFLYRENDDGTITIYDRDQSGSSNERGQEPYLKPFVDYFCKFDYSSYSTSSDWSVNKKRVTKVTPKTFKIDWVDNNTPGLSASIGGLIPIDNDVLVNEGVCCGVVSK